MNESPGQCNRVVGGVLVALGVLSGPAAVGVAATPIVEDSTTETAPDRGAGDGGEETAELDVGWTGGGDVLAGSAVGLWLEPGFDVPDGSVLRWTFGERAVETTAGGSEQLPAVYAEFVGPDEQVLVEVVTGGVVERSVEITVPVVGVRSVSVDDEVIEEVEGSNGVGIDGSAVVPEPSGVDSVPGLAASGGELVDGERGSASPIVGPGGSDWAEAFEVPAEQRDELAAQYLQGLVDAGWLTDEEALAILEDPELLAELGLRLTGEGLGLTVGDDGLQPNGEAVSEEVTRLLGLGSVPVPGRSGSLLLTHAPGVLPKGRRFDRSEEGRHVIGLAFLDALVHLKLIDPVDAAELAMDRSFVADLGRALRDPDDEGGRLAISVIAGIADDRLTRALDVGSTARVTARQAIAAWLIVGDPRGIPRLLRDAGFRFDGRVSVVDHSSGRRLKGTDRNDLVIVLGGTSGGGGVDLKKGNDLVIVFGGLDGGSQLDLDIGGDTAVVFDYAGNGSDIEGNQGPDDMALIGQVGDGMELDLGDEDDRVLVSGVVDDLFIDGDKGNDRALAIGDLSRLDFEGEKGNDELTVIGELEASRIDGDKGDDRFSVYGAVIDSYLEFDRGDDRIDAFGVFDSSRLKTGRHDDEVRLEGLFADGSIHTGAGDDRFEFTGAFTNSTFEGRSGDDTIEFLGDLTDSSLDGNRGNDTITASGVFEGSFIGGGNGGDVIRIESGRARGLVLDTGKNKAKHGDDQLILGDVYGEFNIQDPKRSFVYKGSKKVHQQDVVLLLGPGWESYTNEKGGLSLRRVDPATGEVLADVEAIGDADNLERIVGLVTPDADPNVFQNLDPIVKRRPISIVLSTVGTAVSLFGTALPPLKIVGGALQAASQIIDGAPIEQILIGIVKTAASGLEALGTVDVIENGIKVGETLSELGEIASIVGDVTRIAEAVDKFVDGDALGGLFSIANAGLGFAEFEGAITADIVKKFEAAAGGVQRIVNGDDPFDYLIGSLSILSSAGPLFVPDEVVTDYSRILADIQTGVKGLEFFSAVVNGEGELGKKISDALTLAYDITDKFAEVPGEAPDPPKKDEEVTVENLPPPPPSTDPAEPTAEVEPTPYLPYGQRLAELSSLTPQQRRHRDLNALLGIERTFEDAGDNRLLVDGNGEILVVDRGGRSVAFKEEAGADGVDLISVGNEVVAVRGPDGSVSPYEGNGWFTQAVELVATTDDATGDVLGLGYRTTVFPTSEGSESGGPRVGPGTSATVDSSLVVERLSDGRLVDEAGNPVGELSASQLGLGGADHGNSVPDYEIWTIIGTDTAGVTDRIGYTSGDISLETWRRLEASGQLYIPFGSGENPAEARAHVALGYAQLIQDRQDLVDEIDALSKRVELNDSGEVVDGSSKLGQFKKLLVQAKHQLETAQNRIDGSLIRVEEVYCNPVNPTECFHPSEPVQVQLGLDTGNHLSKPVLAAKTAEEVFGHLPIRYRGVPEGQEALENAVFLASAFLAPFGGKAAAAGKSLLDTLDNVADSVDIAPQVLDTATKLVTLLEDPEDLDARRDFKRSAGQFVQMLAAIQLSSAEYRVLRTGIEVPWTAVVNGIRHRRRANGSYFVYDNDGRLTGIVSQAQLDAFAAVGDKSGRDPFETLRGPIGGINPNLLNTGAGTTFQPGSPIDGSTAKSPATEVNPEHLSGEVTSSLYKSAMVILGEDGAEAAQTFLGQFGLQLSPDVVASFEQVKQIEATSAKNLAEAEKNALELEIEFAVTAQIDPETAYEASVKGRLGAQIDSVLKNNPQIPDTLENRRLIADSIREAGDFYSDQTFTAPLDKDETYQQYLDNLTPSETLLPPVPVGEVDVTSAGDQIATSFGIDGVEIGDQSVVVPQLVQRLNQMGTGTTTLYAVPGGIVEIDIVSSAALDEAGAAGLNRLPNGNGARLLYTPSVGPGLYLTLDQLDGRDVREVQLNGSTLPATSSTGRRVRSSTGVDNRTITVPPPSALDGVYDGGTRKYLDELDLSVGAPTAVEDWLATASNGLPGDQIYAATVDGTVIAFRIKRPEDLQLGDDRRRQIALPNGNLLVADNAEASVIDLSTRHHRIRPILIATGESDPLDSSVPPSDTGRNEVPRSQPRAGSEGPDAQGFTGGGLDYQDGRGSVPESFTGNLPDGTQRNPKAHDNCVSSTCTFVLSGLFGSSDLSATNPSPGGPNVRPLGEDNEHQLSTGLRDIYELANVAFADGQEQNDWENLFYPTNDQFGSGDPNQTADLLMQQIAPKVHGADPGVVGVVYFRRDGDESPDNDLASAHVATVVLGTNGKLAIIEPASRRGGFRLADSVGNLTIVDGRRLNRYKSASFIQTSSTFNPESRFANRGNPTPAEKLLNSAPIADNLFGPVPMTFGEDGLRRGFEFGSPTDEISFPDTDPESFGTFDPGKFTLDLEPSDVTTNAVEADGESDVDDAATTTPVDQQLSVIDQLNVDDLPSEIRFNPLHAGTLADARRLNNDPDAKYSMIVFETTDGDALVAWLPRDSNLENIALNRLHLERRVRGTSASLAAANGLLVTPSLPPVDPSNAGSDVVPVTPPPTEIHPLLVPEEIPNQTATQAPEPLRPTVLSLSNPAFKNYRYVKVSYLGKTGPGKVDYIVELISEAQSDGTRRVLQSANGVVQTVPGLTDLIPGETGPPAIGGVEIWPVGTDVDLNAVDCSFARCSVQGGGWVARIGIGRSPDETSFHSSVEVFSPYDALHFLWSDPTVPVADKAGALGEVLNGLAPGAGISWRRHGDVTDHVAPSPEVVPRLTKDERVDDLVASVNRAKNRRDLKNAFQQSFGLSSREAEKLAREFELVDLDDRGANGGAPLGGGEDGPGGSTQVLPQGEDAPVVFPPPDTETVEIPGEAESAPDAELTPPDSEATGSPGDDPSSADPSHESETEEDGSTASAEVEMVIEQRYDVSAEQTPTGKTIIIQKVLRDPVDGFEVPGGSVEAVISDGGTLSIPSVRSTRTELFEQAPDALDELVAADVKMNDGLDLFDEVLLNIDDPTAIKQVRLGPVVNEEITALIRSGDTDQAVRLVERLAKRALAPYGLEVGSVAAIRNPDAQHPGPDLEFVVDGIGVTPLQKPVSRTNPQPTEQGQPGQLSLSVHATESAGGNWLIRADIDAPGDVDGGSAEAIWDPQTGELEIPWVWSTAHKNRGKPALDQLRQAGEKVDDGTSLTNAILGAVDEPTLVRSITLSSVVHEPTKQLIQNGQDERVAVRMRLWFDKLLAPYGLRTVDAGVTVLDREGGTSLIRLDIEDAGN